MSGELAILIPVLGRPQNVKPTLRSIRKATPAARAVFIPDPDDRAEINALERHEADWFACEGNYARKINEGVARTDEPYILFAADDLEYHRGWFGIAKGMLSDEVGVVATNDLCNHRVTNGELATHPLVARWYAESDTIDQSPGPLFEGYPHEYCTPPETPVWKDDLTFGPIGDVEPGDRVIGWRRSPRGPTGMNLDALCVSEVLAVGEREAPIVEVTTETGRTVRCTPDHLWRNGDRHNAARDSSNLWVPPEVGRSLTFVAEPPPPVPAEHQRLAGWLAGIYDGEGHNGGISQSAAHNPVVFAEIERALTTLGVPHSVQGEDGYGMGGFTLRGGWRGYLDFLLRIEPVRRRGLTAMILDSRVGGRCRWGQGEEIVAVEPVGDGTVLSMTTETGNYVAGGFASKNCDREFSEVARSRGAFRFAKDAIVEHLHPLCGKGDADDELYAKIRERMVTARPIYVQRRRMWLRRMVFRERRGRR